jgi:hypothetical protein
MLRRNEGLVGGIILAVVTLLALMLAGCDDSYERTLKLRRSAAFTECEGFCRATPLAVKFDEHGRLSECRCDVVFSEVE